MPTYARFDDLRPLRRHSFDLSDTFDSAEASNLDEVESVLSWAEEEVADGRWVAGFVAYEAASAFDPAMETNQPIPGLPLAWFASFRRRNLPVMVPSGRYTLGEWSSQIDPEQYRSSFREIQTLIKAGDTYQVDYTFRTEAKLQGDPRSFYEALIRSQSCGYGAFIDAGRWKIISASPELFFEWHNQTLVCKPMKGTAQRGTNVADDEERRFQLLASEKNRAENLMIVDMVRNDMGRVCEIGSIEVPEIFTIEKFDTLWQMTSTVKGRTGRNTTLGEVFKSLFPCASVTGAPKISAMKAIRRLEPDPRGVYCGAIGFGEPDRRGNPRWVFSVGIRTVLLDTRLRQASYGTGGGITYDSNWEEELAEAALKTTVLETRFSDFSLLETMRYSEDTGILLRELHLERLSSSAEFFGIPIDISQIDTLLDSISRPCLVRLTVDRTGEPRVSTHPLPLPSKPRLAIDDRPIDLSDLFLAHKTTNRMRYQEALKRFPEAEDVVLWNRDGNVTETCIGNLAVLLNGEWITPPLADGCLPGVMRRELLRTSQLIEGSFPVEALREAAEIARFNSVRGWEPAEMIVQTS